MNNKKSAAVYIGPTIIKYNLSNNQCFKGGVPYEYPPFKILFEKCSLFKYLFVSPKELIKKKSTLDKAGTIENQAKIQLISEVMGNGNV